MVLLLQWSSEAVRIVRLENEVLQVSMTFEKKKERLPPGLYRHFLPFFCEPIDAYWRQMTTAGKGPHITQLTGHAFSIAVDSSFVRE